MFFGNLREEEIGSVYRFQACNSLLPATEQFSRNFEILAESYYDFSGFLTQRLKTPRFQRMKKILSSLSLRTLKINDGQLDTEPTRKT